jgi:hypothetical protein
MPQATAKQLEPIGVLPFEGLEFDLASLPSNEEDRTHRARFLPWMRVAAIFMRYLLCCRAT